MGSTGLHTCMLTPIWGAARPTPGASLMVATIVSTRSCNSLVPNILSGTRSATCAPSSASSRIDTLTSILGWDHERQDARERNSAVPYGAPVYQTGQSWSSSLAGTSVRWPSWTCPFFCSNLGDICGTCLSVAAWSQVRALARKMGRKPSVPESLVSRLICIANTWR